MADVDATDAVAALARLDFGFFLRRAFNELGGQDAYSHNWHIDAIIHQLDLVRQGENRRLIVTMPPRHLKSRMISIAWVAWMLGHNPALSFLCVSYGQDLSDDYARDCLKIMLSRWYREAFPNTVIKRSSVSDIRTTVGGRRMATSVDGATTGFGADFIIVDDPMKGQDAMSPAARDKVTRWFDDTLSQRLNNQLYGSIIVVMQRLHEGDLVGVLKERESWRELCLPAIATRDENIQLPHGRVYRRREGCALHPSRLPLSELISKRANNPYVFASQFQQQPVPLEGNWVKPAWFGTFQNPPSTGLTILSLDTASTEGLASDYSVGIVARYYQKRFYILDVRRARLEFRALLSLVTDLCRRYRVDRLLVEHASSGIQLIHMLRPPPNGVPFPIACKPEGPKEVRFFAQASRIEAGEVLLPEAAPWSPEFVSEIAAFPGGRFDDQADAFAQLLRHGAPYEEPTTIPGPTLYREGKWIGDDAPTTGQPYIGDPWGA